ncbi:MAG: glycolate oxidase subunit GlcE [Gammaproteobacteria bacterium]|nr:glycolate oxidase subunit GlcE [Gammaproteobacteria bacterium]
MTDTKETIAARIRDAARHKTALQLLGGNTKAFYGRSIQATPLCLADYSGVVEYEPSELYITARCGTPLTAIEQIIGEENQMLPFEPPHFGTTATLGGAIAAGLAGPGRVSSGTVRDSMLGAEIINGKGEYLCFGGKVMKNVAGYDVSRLMCGALGTLGVLMSVTLRLLPKPQCEQTVVIAEAPVDAIHKMNAWALTPMPITATFHDGKSLYVRLTGSSSTIEKCQDEIGGERIEQSELFWIRVREQTHEAFASDAPLWRIQVPPSTDPLDITGPCAMEWNGALRWHATHTDASTIREVTRQAGGQACQFRGPAIEHVFNPLPSALLKIHQRLKHAFDPEGILNPGKMYPQF